MMDGKRITYGNLVNKKNPDYMNYTDFFVFLQHDSLYKVTQTIAVAQKHVCFCADILQY